jgi:hypothetical protein
VYACPAKAPQSRTEASTCASFRDVQPEITGYGAPAYRALLHRQVGEQALDRNGQRYEESVHTELEIIEQVEREMGSRPVSPGVAVASDRPWSGIHRHDGN